ncbi:hypothetical protein Ga0076813_10711, partial [endosymbiont of Ridgeia piscesae]
MAPCIALDFGSKQRSTSC